MLSFSGSSPSSQKGSRVIKFKKQVMIADNCYYVDNDGDRHEFVFSDKLKSLRFVGPRSQEFILESNGNSDIRFYSLQVKRNGQQLILYNDFVSVGEKLDFYSRKVGWIVDLNKDGYFDLLQRDKLQIYGNKNAQVSKSQQRTVASDTSIYKTDVINYRIWDKVTKSFLEKPFHSQQQRDQYYKDFDFKFRWK